ncbi:kinase-like domain-containing protein [Polychytrium aggregatum]|uniref:kinase-like domain-containing protein n=1 Tax=Polychytrium aggregatum TaxID=110093 RepID=UPI0022FF3D6D|nr:kinase-like domain-containing protein [Polychytrium aggregatum]KAI9190658.1 kinase-like domain-containing protein [Polychytrium aggregatum]
MWEEDEDIDISGPLYPCRVLEKGSVRTSRKSVDVLKSSPTTRVVVGTYQGQAVAIKRFQKPPYSKHNPLVAFNWEVKVWAELNHPRISKLIGIYFSSGIAMTVSQLEVNRDLVTFMFTHPPVELPIKVRWMADIARGLEYLHANRFVHGDIKPTHALLDDQLRVSLIDFVCAFKIREGLEGNSMIENKEFDPFGTYEYMAPELVRSHIPLCPNFNSDVYAVGVSCCEILLDGRDAWDEPVDDIDTIRRFHQASKRPTISGGIDRRLRRIIEDCLSVKATTRPSSADLHSRFMELLDTHDETSSAPPSVPPSETSVETQARLDPEDQFFDADGEFIDMEPEGLEEGEIVEEYIHTGEAMHVDSDQDTIVDDPMKRLTTALQNESFSDAMEIIEGLDTSQPDTYTSDSWTDVFSACKEKDDEQQRFKRWELGYAFILGWLYHLGLGTEQDNKLATNSWFRVSNFSNQDDLLSKALKSMADLLKNWCQCLGIGIRENWGHVHSFEASMEQNRATWESYPEIRWLSIWCRFASRRSTFARIILIQCHSLGFGTERSNDTAIGMACELVDREPTNEAARAVLGELYFAQCNYERAIANLIQATSFPKARYLLGQCFEHGYGVTANAKMALFHYKSKPASKYQPSRERVVGLSVQ